MHATQILCVGVILARGGGKGSPIPVFRLKFREKLGDMVFFIARG